MLCWQACACAASVAVNAIASRAHRSVHRCVFVIAVFVTKSVLAFFFRRWQVHFLSDQQARTSASVLRRYLSAPYAFHLQRTPAELHGLHKGKDEVVCWPVRADERPFAMRVIPGQAERIRHHRKYAEGDVRYQSFYFRGPTGKHNLKAQNLNVFCQIAEGIGEETWIFHLRRNVIKNRDLAAAVEDIERRIDLDPAQTRALVCAAIEARYTLPG